MIGTRIHPAGGALVRLAAVAHAVTRPDVQAELYLIPRGETPRAQAASRAIRVRFSRPGEKEKQARMQKDLWQQPGHRERMTRIRRKVVRKARYRARMRKAAWANEKVKQVQAHKARSRWKKPAYRAAIVEAGRTRWQDPAYRARILEVLEKARARKKEIAR